MRKGGRDRWEASMADSMEDWPPPAAITTFADGDPAEDPWVRGAPSVEAIEITAYSSEWPVLFEAGKELIAQALPGVALNIEHVGSTAVPNLAAKLVIDMDLIVVDPTQEETYVPALGELRLSRPREGLANCASRVVQARAKGRIDQTSTDLVNGADGLLRTVCPSVGEV
jgi:hypothetical protein